MQDQEFLNIRRWWRVLAGWALIGLGALFILLGWFGVSGDPNVARQLSYLASGGIGGLAAAVVGVGLLISEDLRSERRRLGRIESAVLDVREMLQAQVAAPNGSTPEGAQETQEVTASTSGRRRRSR